MTPRPESTPEFWRGYATHMLAQARRAKSPRVRAVWIAGVRRARLNLAALKVPAQGRLL